MIRLLMSFIFIFSFFSIHEVTFAENETDISPPEATDYKNRPSPPFVMPNMPPGMILPDQQNMEEMPEYLEAPEEGTDGSQDLGAPEVIMPYKKEEAAPLEQTNKPLPKKEEVTKVGSSGLKAAMLPSNNPKTESHDKISLDLKGVDIVDVLKMLSLRSNMNIVAGKNVRGKVTLFLKEVDLWDAFEIILASNELAYDRRADIINVMTERDYELLYGEKYNSKTKVKIIKLENIKASEAAKSLNQIKSRVGKIISDDNSNTLILVDSPVVMLDMEDMIVKLDTPIETRIYALNYAKAEDLKVKINELLTKGSGLLQVDERTNKIVVTDTVKKLEDVEKVIEAFDERHMEVLIDAEILEITLSDEAKMGIDWQEILKKFHNLSLKSAFSLQAAGAGGLGELVVGSLTGKEFYMLVQILQTLGKTKTLSRPRIVALNNQEAKILVGTKQPYTTETVVTPGTGASTTATNVTFVDVGIKLYVTPTINREGFITMKIRPEVSSASATPYTTTASVKIPIVSTSEAETTVMVEDGNTLVIGGLMKDIDEKSINQIPILGDIPILGYLFKKFDTTITKAEIVIFLTPHIITGERDISPLTGLDTKVKMAKSALGKEETVRLTRLPVKPDYKVIKIPEPQPKVIEKPVVKEVEKEVIKEIPKFVEIPIQVSPSTMRIGSSYGYYELVRDKVLRYARVKTPSEKLSGDVKIYFRVASDGTLADDPKIMNSTNARLSAITKESIVEAAPFPPFPRSLEKESEAFTLTISYE